jgi:hypothetical protein
MLVRLKSRHTVGVAWKPSTFLRKGKVTEGKNQRELAGMRLPGNVCFGQGEGVDARRRWNRWNLRNWRRQYGIDVFDKLRWSDSLGGVLLGIVIYRGSRGD